MKPETLCRFFRERRLAMFPKSTSLGDLARHCGYHNNTSKGCNKIKKFEETGIISPVLFDKLVRALGVSSQELAACVSGDVVVWEKWANERIEPHLIVRAMAAVYCPIKIPADIHSNQVEMEKYARNYAAVEKKEVCLVLSRRHKIWFKPSGESRTTEETFYQSYEPFMKLGKHKVLANLVWG